MRRKFGFLKTHCKDIDFFFPDAPHLLEKDKKEGSGERDAEEEERRTWYRYKEEDHIRYRGMARTMEFLRDYERENGPFDGVVGFSQGAFLATILCALECYPPHIDAEKSDPLLSNSPSSSSSSSSTPSSSQTFSSSSSSIQPSLVVNDEDTPLESLTPIPFRFKFGIFIGGAPPRDESFFSLYLHPISSQSLPRIPLPSLHIFGEADKIIPMEKSKALANLFENPQIYQHPMGHVIPGGRESRDMFSSFMMERR